MLWSYGNWISMWLLPFLSMRVCIVFYCRTIFISIESDAGSFSAFFSERSVWICDVLIRLSFLPLQTFFFLPPSSIYASVRGLHNAVEFHIYPNGGSTAFKMHVGDSKRAGEKVHSSWHITSSYVRCPLEAATRTRLNKNWESIVLPSATWETSYQHGKGFSRLEYVF